MRTIDLDKYSDEQVAQIEALLKKFEEETDPIMMAANAISNQYLDEYKQLAKELFTKGALWQRDLLTEDEYKKIAYVLAAAFSTDEYDDKTKASAMAFVGKICKVFRIDIKDML